ncbi:MAG: HNH endonuclease signature motif containing protein [Pseudomonadota bacterium]
MLVRETNLTKHERLLSQFRYNGKHLIHRVRRKGVTDSMVGTPAGCVDRTGYRFISFCCRNHLAHRLTWFYVHGKWPDGEIDHINHDRDDNRIENLRIVDRAGNMRNLSNSHGVLFEGGKWRARLGSQHLGIFDDYFEAWCTRKRAEVERWA